MHTIETALTFDDILLIPDYSEVLPKDVKLQTQLTRNLTLNIPLVAAAMDTVTEARLAIAMAEEGGIGILHKNMTIAAQAAEVRKVKKFESGVVRDPVTVNPNTTLGELLDLVKTHHFASMPVVEGKKLVGIVTNRDVRFASDPKQLVTDLMTPKDKLITATATTSRAELIELFKKHRIEKIPLVDDKYQLCGMVTVKDILRSQEKPNACRDDAGRLRVAAAVGTAEDTEKRISALIEADVDVIVVDTAHGHSQKVLATAAWIKQHYPNIQLIAGNIATADAALALAKAGVDAVKVGIGSGSICTTRIIAGVGVPQITAIYNVAQALKDKNIPIIADGGIRFSGDIAKAIAAGASCVTIGSLFAGTEEAPGDIEFYQGQPYKSYRGMGSVAAMHQAQGSADRYFQEGATAAQKLVPEGIEGRVPYKGYVAAIIYQLLGGLRASMGYTGSASINDLRSKTKLVRITNAGLRESHVHDVVITKEAPNYWVEK